jgi:hypothetical protein
MSTPSGPRLLSDMSIISFLWTGPMNTCMHVVLFVRLTGGRSLNEVTPSMKSKTVHCSRNYVQIKIARYGSAENVKPHWPLSQFIGVTL